MKGKYTKLVSKGQWQAMRRHAERLEEMDTRIARRSTAKEDGDKDETLAGVFEEWEYRVNPPPPPSYRGHACSPPPIKASRVTMKDDCYK